MARETRKTSETWVETIKVSVCALVVISALLESLLKTNIISRSAGYIWFSQMMQYILAPLFFVYNGYEFQKGNPIKTTDEWLHNVGRKLVTLGVPFGIFCCANWAVEALFLAEPGADLIQALFVRPTAPYWYFYALFLIYLITPTINTKISAVIMCAFALAAKAVTFFWKGLGIFAVDVLMAYWIWFVLGMTLAFVKAPTTLRKQKGVQRIGIALAAVFFAGSVAVIARNVSSSILNFIFGIMGCSAVVVLLITVKFSDNARRASRKVAAYALPLLLMYTIFAGLTKGVLLKAGITNAFIHIVLGLVIGIVGPVLIGFVFKKLKWAEFILYPGKFIKFGSKDEEMNHGKKA